MIKLFSYTSPIATFEIWCPEAGFNYAMICDHRSSRRYELHGDNQVLGRFETPYDAILAVAQHRTGWQEWDDSGHDAPDYLPEWQSHVDDKLRLRVIQEYLQKAGSPSYRELTDYVRLAHPGLMCRMELVRLMEHLAVTGQLSRLPNDALVPAEFRRVAESIKQWQREDASE